MPYLPLYPTGTMIYLTHGEYSDYKVIGVFVLLKPLAIDVAIQLGKQTNEEYALSLETGNYVQSEDRFLALLINAGYLIEVNCVEFRIGSYGSVNVEGMMGADNKTAQGKERPTLLDLATQTGPVEEDLNRLIATPNPLMEN